jgi:uncharacterized UBP type Zn finger protein
MSSAPSTRLGTGIQNSGTTCHLAALLQVFFHLPSIREQILTYPLSSKEEKLTELQLLMIELLEKENVSADAHALVAQLNLEFGYWDKYQDCSETFSLMERRFPALFERVFRSAKSLR